MNRHVSFGWCSGLVGVGILIGSVARAQTASPATPAVTTPPATVSTNVQDYGQGFRSFIRMGLPDTSKARYVKLEYYGGGMSDMMSYRMNEIQLSGNAWLVSENKEDKSVLVTAVGRTLELLDQKVAMKKQEAAARSNAVTQASTAKKGGTKTSFMMSNRANLVDEAGSWTSVDLSRDLAKATALVDKKIKAKSAGGREMRYDNFMQSDEPAGMLFLLAAFAWQNGQTQAANALAGRLFTLVGDSRKVIVGALNVMADAQLAATSDTFRKTNDWKAYHAEVLGLLKKFPAGWRKAGAVKLLADRLQARAALSEPAPVTGEGLGEEDMKLAAALASETNRAGMHMWSGHLWIFPPAKATRVMKDDSTMGRIQARGVKSIPLLIALASDETLCPLRRNDVGMSTYTSYSSNDSEKPEADRAKTFYAQMDRPLTRGEIARGLLTPLCKREENSRHDESEVTPEEVVEGARQVYAAIKALPPSGLASYFLKNGDQNQKQSAIGYMLENDLETNAPVIEAFLLTPPSDESGVMMMGMGNGLAQQYVQKRGEKAADFVEKYAAMRKKIELPAGMADNAEYVKQMEKQAEREMKTLRAMVKKQDLSSTVADLAKTGDNSEVSMTAYTALGRLPPTEAVPALLTAAVKATNTAVRARILQMVPMLRYSGMQEAITEEMAEVGQDGMEAAMKKMAGKNKLNIGTNAAAWKILLADTRSMPGGNAFTGGTDYTIADLAAGGIESVYGDVSVLEQYGRHGGSANLNPEVLMKVTRARAAARLDGKTEDQMPKFPSADDVTPERRKAIETDVLKATPATLGAILDKFTDSESLYLTEAAGENSEIMKAMAPLSRRITAVKMAPTLPAAEAARLQKMSGTMVSTNVIAEMREFCKRQLATGAAFAVTLSSGGLGKGLRLDVAAVDEKALNTYGYSSMLTTMGKGRKGMVMGMLRSGEHNGYGMWLVDLPAASTGTVAEATAEASDKLDDQADTFATMFGSQQEQFESVLETFCKPDESIGPGASLSFTGILPPKDKDKKKDADDDENAFAPDVMF